MHIYSELKKTAEKKGISIKEDPFFKMHTFRTSKDLSEKHDEIYQD